MDKTTKQRLFKFILLFAVILMSASAHSADLADSDITTFSPGSPVNAGDFNNNFDNTKNAINTKQDKISGSCPSGQYMRQINADGTVVCQLDAVGSGGGGIAGVSTQEATGVFATTNVGGIVDIRLDNNLLNNNAINALKAEDGSGSNVDADLLDGRNSTDFTSSDQSCGANQVVSGVDATGNVNCTNHISEVTSASTLVGGGTSGSVNLEVDTTVMQRRVTGGCPLESSIRSIAENGDVTCEVDSDNGINGVTAGNHLSSTGPASNPTLDVTGMPGVAFLQNLAAVGLGSSMQTINTLTVTPQFDGWLMVNVTGTGICGDSYDGFGHVTIQLQNVTAGISSPEMRVASGALINGNDVAEGFSASYVFAVTAIANNINFRARCSGFGGGQVQVNSFNAAYFPNRLN